MSDGYGLKIAGIVRLGGVLERTSEEFGLPESPNGPARRTSSQHSLKSRYEQSGETVGRRFSARRNSSTGNVRRHWQPTSTTRTRRRGNHRRKPETSAPGARVESKTRPPYKPRPKGNRRTMISSTGSGFATDDNEVTASGCSIPTRHRSHHATGWERRRHLGRAAAPTGRHAAADRGAVCAPAGPPDHGAARLRRASVRRGHQGACHHPEDPTDTPVNAIAAVMLSSRGAGRPSPCCWPSGTGLVRSRGDSP